MKSRGCAWSSFDEGKNNFLSTFFNLYQLFSMEFSLTDAWRDNNYIRIYKKIV